MSIEKQVYPDWYWLGEEQEKFLANGYVLEGVDPKDRYHEIADHAESILKAEAKKNGKDDSVFNGYADRFYAYIAKGYYSISTPVMCNFGLKRGLPISCFGSYVEDSVEGILKTLSEVGMMGKYGGGTSAYFGEVRPRGSAITNNGESNGSFSFLENFESIINTISQGTSRRSQFAGYIDIEHKDVREWLTARQEGSPIQVIFHGICVGDQWLQEMINGDMEKRETWALILEARRDGGVPYIFFRDNALKGRPDVYQSPKYPIHASNLCTEIMLPSNKDESFVCCLSSINLVHWDEIIKTDAIELMVYFLDAVMEEFIERVDGKAHMQRAHRFASRHRALGLGVLGWHSLLQSRMLPFNSSEALKLTRDIFEGFKERTYTASEFLGDILGVPEVLKEAGIERRNTTLMSVAPTKSSSFILGQVSQGVEPFKTNFFIRDSAKLKTLWKNPFLEKVLAQYDMNTNEVWDSIIVNGGSVQHLDFLSDKEKEVFLTFGELDQTGIIRQAGLRQRYIDQGQSINLMIDPNLNPKSLNELYLYAHKVGLKAIYYTYGYNAAQELNRNLATCESCEA